MVRTFLTALILVIPAVVFGAEEKPASKQADVKKSETVSAADEADEISENDSPLVRAAKQSRAKKSGKTVVITDADVKKSKGKLSVISSRELPKVEPEPAEPQQPPAEVARASAQKARDEARARFERAQKEVETLERDLFTAEENYYNEDDATIRDQVIEARFDRAKKQLDAAREELASAREALQKLE